MWRGSRCQRARSSTSRLPPTLEKVDNDPSGCRVAHRTMRVTSKQLVFLVALVVTLFLLFGPFAPELEHGESTSSPSTSTPASEVLETVRKKGAGVSETAPDTAPGEASQ